MAKCAGGRRARGRVLGMGGGVAIAARLLRFGLGLGFGLGFGLGLGLALGLGLRLGLEHHLMRLGHPIRG